MSTPPLSRSGACLDDTHPRLHAACSGRFEKRLGQWTNDTETVQCSCPCHMAGTPLSLTVHPRQARLAAR